MGEAYIVDAVRTAGGKKGGRLSAWHPADLAGVVLDGLLDRTGCDPADVDDVVMGCVGQVGEQSLNIARNAVLSSSLPESVPGTSVDRQCGSSQQAIHFAAQAVMSGTMDIVIAAGVESMSRVPMGLPVTLAAEHGFGSPRSSRMDARYLGADINQFRGAELMALKYELSRENLDAFALQSHRRALAATRSGAFESEILGLPVTAADGTESLHLIDEGIRADASYDSIAALRLLRQDGRLTAGTASQICDGAAALLIVNDAGLKRLDRAPRARIHHLTVLGQDPVIMLDAPIPATERALKRTGLTISDI